MIDINEIYYAIQAINSDSSLDEEKRTIRLQIYQTLLYREKAINNLNNLMKEIIIDGKRLEKLSDYDFFINEELEKNRIFIKGYILDSKFISDLKSKGIVNFNFSDIEKYLKQYMEVTDNKVEDIKIAVSLYPKLLNYKDQYKDMYIRISEYLGNIFGEDMVRNSGDIRLKYQRIFERIERMLSRRLFDLKAKEWLEELVNELFSYYVNNTIKLPIDTQIDVNGTKELIS